MDSNKTVLTVAVDMTAEGLMLGLLLQDDPVVVADCFLAFVSTIKRLEADDVDWPKLMVKSMGLCGTDVLRELQDILGCMTSDLHDVLDQRADDWEEDEDIEQCGSIVDNDGDCAAN